MRIRLLVLGTPTPARHLYTRQMWEPHFEPDSSFMGRIKMGTMMGEVTPPTTKEHGTSDQAIQRIREVCLDNVCLQIRNPSLEDDGVYGEISPCGPYGHVVQDMLDRGETPVVAMRALTYNNAEGIIDIHSIIAFDLIAPPCQNPL